MTVFLGVVVALFLMAVLAMTSWAGAVAICMADYFMVPKLIGAA